MSKALPSWLSTPPEPLYDMDEVTRALERMAGELNAAFAGTQPLVLSLMKGGIVTTGLLLPRLDFPLELDYLHVDRYRGARRGGTIHWLRRPPDSISGRTVLLVDDILDKGITMAAAMRACREQGAKLVSCAVLVDKQGQEPRPVKADFAALSVPARFIVGCGLDYRGYLRNLPGIYVLP